MYRAQGETQMYIEINVFQKHFYVQENTYMVKIIDVLVLTPSLFTKFSLFQNNLFVSSIEVKHDISFALNARNTQTLCCFNQVKVLSYITFIIASKYKPQLILR